MNKLLLRLTTASFAIGIFSLLMATNIFATNAGPGGVNPGGCTSGNCVNASSNGAAWVRIAYNSNDSVSLKSLLEGLSGYLGIPDYSDSTVSNCKDSGGYVYTLVTPFSGSDNFTGPVPMNIPTTGKIYNGFTNRTIPSVVPPSDALAVFNDAATNGKINGYAYADNSTMTWFCGAEDVTQPSSFQAKTIAYIRDGTTNTTVAPSWDASINQEYLVTKSETATIYFKHRAKRSDSNSDVTRTTTAARVYKVDRTWSSRDRLLAGGTTTGNPRPFYAGTEKDLSFTNSSWNIGTAASGSTIPLYRGKVKSTSDGASDSDYIVSRTLAAGEATDPICRGIKVQGTVQSTSSGKYKSGSDWKESINCITLRRPWNFTTNANNNLPSLVFVGEDIKSSFKAGFTVKNSNIIASGLPSDAAMIGITFSYNAAVSSASVQLAGGDTDNPCSLFNGSGCRTFDLSGFDVQNYSIGAAPDEVGVKVCTATAINYTESDDNGDAIKKWRVSNANCAVVAKKPSFKTENGNIYSSNDITTSTTYRGNTTYGSWGEYLVIAGSNSSVTKFASGAALRNGIDGNKTTKDFSTLTIANNDNNNIGKSNITPSNSFINSIRTRFINTDNYDHNLVKVKYFADNHEITNDDLAVDSAGQQLIIFSEKSLSIPSSISTINAWLIAGDTINTCANHEYNSDNLYLDCDTSLTIYGIAYAAKFKFLRTYGSINLPTLGAYPNTTAETIRLTPGDYQRAFNYASTNYSQVTEVYTQELAPRN